MALSADCYKLDVPRVPNLATNAFKTDYLSEGKPVIITNALTEWPPGKWTLDSLLEKAGDNVVHVRHNTNCEHYKSGKKYDIRQTTFRKYVTDLIANNARAKNSYLAVQNIKKSFPQLDVWGEVTIPEYVGKVHGGPYLWIARKGHYEYCHYDPDDGLLVMIQGRKKVTLIPCGIDSMYPNPLGTKGRTIQTSVDCDNPDLKKHPLSSGNIYYQGILEPGEMLYIPAMWWHQVTSIEVAISINIFWGDAGENAYLSKVMKPPFWPSFRHWILNIIEQNRSYENFQRTLSRLPEALFNFLKNQWHEDATTEQLDILVKEIMDYLSIRELPQEHSSGKHPPSLCIRGLLWRS